LIRRFIVVAEELHFTRAAVEVAASHAERAAASA
jgi:hypothetical protein